jgi:hypothetical protein
MVNNCSFRVSSLQLFHFFLRHEITIGLTHLTSLSSRLAGVDSVPPCETEPTGYGKRPSGPYPAQCSLSSLRHMNQHRRGRRRLSASELRALLRGCRWRRPHEPFPLCQIHLRPTLAVAIMAQSRQFSQCLPVYVIFPSFFYSPVKFISCLL